ncbi:MAG: YicC family protein [Clostridia bacterium]|nr:YicC family protein [Clostridia bacterium]MBQ6708522.1 YicC family protein [Clostridia bacterium]
MIKSMTGYGRAQMTVDEMSVTVEIKSVNHRYFEFSARTPRAYGFLEEKLKSHFQKSVARGKVDCFVQIEALESDDVTVNVNHTLAKGYVDALHELALRYNLSDDISVSTVSRYSDIFSIHKNEADEEKIWNAVSQVADAACAKFVEMRAVEGAKLKADLTEKIATIEENVSFIEKRSPETVSEYHERLKTKMAELLQDTHIDEQRILTESAIFAEKIAVDEETVRLRSHLHQFGEFLEASEPIGRKMDFLVQEMNREANTIGSKSQDIEIAKRVIAIKSEIEKIREQIQNIE